MDLTSCVDNHLTGIIGFNTQGLKSNNSYVKSLLQEYQVLFICEHWMLNAEKYLLENLANPTHKLFFTPADKHLSGRPFGGVYLTMLS